MFLLLGALEGQKKSWLALYPAFFDLVKFSGQRCALSIRDMLLLALKGKSCAFLAGLVAANLEILEIKGYYP